MKAIPRFPRYAARPLFASMLKRDPQFWNGKYPIALLDHPQVRRQQTSAGVLDRADIESIREGIISAVAPFVEIGVERDRLLNTGEFDRSLARVVGRFLTMSPVAASDEEVWSYLTLLVVPEVVWWRYATPTEERVIGRPRNILRSAWERQNILGQLLYQGPKPLGEDELVGLLERSRLARNYTLIQRLASHLVTSDVASRSEYARRLNVEIVKMTGTLSFDVMNEDDIDRIIQVASQRLVKF